MYIPGSFRENDFANMQELIRGNSFGTLFSQTPEGPFATHLPFLIDPEPAPLGTLRAHMARANPHWRSLTSAVDVLVTFLGPHAYISPSWYVNQVTVPTWNYAAVHAVGGVALIHDKGRLRDHVLSLVREHESYIDPPWNPAAAEPILDAQLGAIVGLEIRIRSLEGKFKFNQNRSREDQAGVIAALSASGDPQGRAVARIMRANLDRAAP
jgi:transcriptional regulator